MKNEIVSHRHLRFLLISIVLAMYSPAAHAAEEETTRYVGSEACKDCHENEYLYFMTYARKSTSFRSIERLKKELSEQEIKGCYACHTTGYGKAGGFESPDKTPHLRNAGCEVCHGPGEYHVKTQDVKHIKGSLTARDCEACHTSERINAFRYKPLIHGGAH